MQPHAFLVRTSFLLLDLPLSSITIANNGRGDTDTTLANREMERSRSCRIAENENFSILLY